MPQCLNILLHHVKLELAGGLLKNGLSELASGQQHPEWRLTCSCCFVGGIAHEVSAMLRRLATKKGPAGHWSAGVPHVQGSGRSQGDYVTLGAHEVDDLEAAVAHLRQDGITGTVGLWGRSMGAVTALLFSQRDPSIAGIVSHTYPCDCILHCNANASADPSK